MKATFGDLKFEGIEELVFQLSVRLSPDITQLRNSISVLCMLRCVYFNV